MAKDVLSVSDRKILCKFLEDNAQDYLLIKAVDDTKEEYSNVRSDFERVRKFIGPGLFFPSPADKVKQVTTPVVPSVPTPPAKSETLNKEPPGQAAKRIGVATSDQIKRILSTKKYSLNDLNIMLNGNIQNTKSLMKLLWERKIVEFNGEEFYLK